MVWFWLFFPKNSNKNKKELVESDWAWAAEMAREQRARSERFKWLYNHFGTNESLGYRLDSSVRTNFFACLLNVVK
jgi:hypothetical protein